MLRCGSQCRFTAAEIDEARRFGIRLDDVRTQDDFACAVAAWVRAVAEVRPDIIERIVEEAARCGRLKLPPRLTLVDPAGTE